MPARRDASTLTTVIFAAVASMLLHLVLWPIGNRVISASRSDAALPRTGGAMEVSLVPAEESKPPPEEDPETKPPSPKEQLVKLDRLEREAKPEHADYVSEFDHRVEQEQRAPRQRPSPGSAAAPRSAPTLGPKSDAEPGMSLDPGSSTQALPLDHRGHDAAPAARRGGSPLPALDPRVVSDLSDDLRREWGSPGTMDALDPDLEEGDGNLLNTRRFRYASFFNRVRDQVAEHWDPAGVQRSHDPDGRVTGRGPRKTILAISLNADGSLHKIAIREASGAPFLDEEAIRAVRAAAPFSNPPPQLVDAASGHIDFLFGFILEVGGSKRIFRYQR